MQLPSNDRTARIVVLPSLDYELFHGRNFLSDEETLFAPTQRILERAQQFGMPVTLFADVLCLQPYRESGLQLFVERFERQLCEAIREGHDVQLHIHPHWTRAIPSSDGWMLREPVIRLADLDPAEARSVISSAATYLRELLSRADPSYECVAYRAGGLALQPDERALIGMLHDEGIRIDSSIAPGLRVASDVIDIDYSALPRGANWLISAENGLSRGGERSLFEIPIATFSMSFLSRVRFLAGRVAAFRRQRGAGISRSVRQTRWVNTITLLRENTRYLTASPVFLFSADTKGFTRSMLVKGFRRFVRMHQSSSDSPLYVSMINHPKLMFEREEHLFFDTLRELADIFGSDLRFSSYRSVAAETAARTVSISA